MKSNYLPLLKFGILMFVTLIFNANVSAQTYVTLPYSTGFESGVLDAAWGTTSDQTTGEIAIFASGFFVWNNITANANTGTNFLGMHNANPGGTYNTNQADLHLDLANSTNVRFSFWWTHWDDEAEVQDGLFISDDGGTTYTKVHDFPGSNVTLNYEHYDFDLDSINAIHGLSFTSTYIIRFQQYDNFYFAGGNDGHLVDDVSVYQTCLPESLTVVACDSFISPSGAYTWFTSGIHNDTILAINACGDSAITVDLTISNYSESVETVEICSYYIWSVNGNVYTSSIQDTVLLENSAGCDSLVILDLTVFQPEFYFDTVQACNEYTWPVNGITYDNSIIFNTLLGGVTGCDSSVTLVLTINDSDSLYETTSSCNSFTWPENGQTYSQTGVYTDNYTNAAGCPSSRTLDLTVVPVDTTLSFNDNILSSNAVGASYQWLDCNDNFAPINNGANPTISVSLGNSYALEVTENGCVDTSACNGFYLSIEDGDLGRVTIFPNPSNGLVNIDLGELSDVNIRVYNVGGQMVFNADNINDLVYQFELNEPAGTYFIELTNKDIKQQYKLIIE